jgi:hypothetical protein
VGSGFIVVVVAEGALRRAARRGKEKGFDPKASSKTSVVAVAYTAVPLVYERTGVRGFCIDDTGVILTTRDGTAPAVNAGRCQSSERTTSLQ